MQDENSKSKEELAKEWRTSHREFLKISFQATISFGVEAMKAAGLVNAAFAAAALTYLSNLIKEKNISAAFEMRQAVACFSIGILFAAIASAFSYLAQKNYTQSNGDHNYLNEPPYLEPTAKFKKLRRSGKRWETAAIVLVCVSFLLTAIGLCFAWRGLGLPKA